MTRIKWEKTLEAKELLTARKDLKSIRLSDANGFAEKGFWSGI